MKICVSKIQNTIKNYITQKDKKLQLFILFILLFLFLYIILYNVREGFSMGSLTGGGGSSSSQYKYLAPPNDTTTIKNLTVDEQNAFIEKYNTVNDLSGNPNAMNQNQLNQLNGFLTGFSTADEIKYYTENGSFPYNDYVTSSFVPVLQKRFPNRFAYMYLDAWSNESKLNTNAYQVYTGKITDPEAGK